MTLKAKNICVYPCLWIQPRHDKIALCFCHDKNFLFWFNTASAYHGVGQLPVKRGEHPAIWKDCFLDLSSVKGISSAEIKSVQDRGAISLALTQRIIVALKEPIPTLAAAHRDLALKNLT